MANMFNERCSYLFHVTSHWTYALRADEYFRGGYQQDPVTSGAACRICYRHVYLAIIDSPSDTVVPHKAVDGRADNVDVPETAPIYRSSSPGIHLLSTAQAGYIQVCILGFLGVGAEASRPLNDAHLNPVRAPGA